MEWNEWNGMEAASSGSPLLFGDRADAGLRMPPPCPRPCSRRRSGRCRSDSCRVSKRMTANELPFWRRATASASSRWSRAVSPTGGSAVLRRSVGAARQRGHPSTLILCSRASAGTSLTLPRPWTLRTASMPSPPGRNPLLSASRARSTCCPARPADLLPLPADDHAPSRRRRWRRSGTNSGPGDLPTPTAATSWSCTRRTPPGFKARSGCCVVAPGS